MPIPLLSPLPDYTSAAHAAKVDATLCALQNHNHAAMHVWEKSWPDIAPGDIITVLKNDPKALKKNIEKSLSTELLSMSLLPTAKSGKSMIPFGARKEKFPTPAYLFDVRPTMDGPFIVGASPTNAISGELYSYKRMSHVSRKFLPDLHRAYPLELDFRKAVAGNPALSEYQLTSLGKSMEQDSRDVLPHNEILVGASLPQLKALCIYNYAKETKDLNEHKIQNSKSLNQAKFVTMAREAQHASLELLGALHGLDHLERGINIPVVFYDVNGVNQGKLTFFAQGKEMLTKKVVLAIKTLQRYRIDLRAQVRNDISLDALRTLCEELLDIDLAEPIKPPSAAVPTLPVNHAQYHGKQTERIRFSEEIIRLK